MTKAQKLKERNKLLNILVIVIDTVVFVRVIFNLALTLNGNWDDLSTSSIMVLVSSAMVALFFALLNNYKYKGHPSYVLASVLVLGMAALFFMYVLIAASYVKLMGV
ncbi:MAG: hypothetical protein K5837_02155 [Candidatus Saccharibacteria bacterium]|nr:hypothetical protein [Candidatus Saccharibacteria bacterium]